MLKNFIREMDNDLKICKTLYFRERKSMNEEYLKSNSDSLLFVYKEKLSNKFAVEHWFKQVVRGMQSKRK